MTRRLLVIACLVTFVAWSAPARAQSASATPEATSGWELFASLYTFVVPSGTSFVQPLFTADRGRLHVEARYNYEGLRTASLWAGVNFSGGDAVTWELTPIAGAIFGDTMGVAPGYKGSIGWRRLLLYSESEYVIDTDDAADSFLYNWSEFTVAPTDTLRVGLVVQRTRVYETARDVQRGLIVGYAYRSAEFTLCVFNPDDDKPAVAFSAGVRF